MKVIIKESTYPEIKGISLNLKPIKMALARCINTGIELIDGIGQLKQIQQEHEANGTRHFKDLTLNFRAKGCTYFINEILIPEE